MGRTLFSRRVLGIIAVSVISLIGCCLLAWWQWTRYEAPTGTLQNLGYVLQWPLFGIFPAVMFWRLNRAAREARAQQSAVAGADAPATATAERTAVPAPRTADVPAAVQPRPVADRAPAPVVREWTSQRAYVQNRRVADDDEQDPDLLAYNRYLAQLNAREDGHAR